MAKIIWTEEEKAAQKVENLLVDVRLDAEQIGRYLARQPLIVTLEKAQALVRGFLEENDPYLQPVNFNEAYHADLKGEVVKPKPHTVTKPPLWDNSDSEEVVEVVRGDYGTPFNKRCELLAKLYLSDWAEENPEFIEEYELAFALAYHFEEGNIAYNVKMEMPILTLWLAVLKEFEHDNDYDLKTINEVYATPYEETVNQELVTKCELIHKFKELFEADGRYGDIIEHFNISFEMAEAVSDGIITTFNENSINELWNEILEALELEGNTTYEVLKHFETL